MFKNKEMKNGYDDNENLKKSKPDSFLDLNSCDIKSLEKSDLENKNNELFIRRIFNRLLKIGLSSEISYEKFKRDFILLNPFDGSISETWKKMKEFEFLANVLLQSETVDEKLEEYSGEKYESGDWGNYLKIISEIENIYFRHLNLSNLLEKNNDNNSNNGEFFIQFSNFENNSLLTNEYKKKNFILFLKYKNNNDDIFFNHVLSSLIKNTYILKSHELLYRINTTANYYIENDLIIDNENSSEDSKIKEIFIHASRAKKIWESKYILEIDKIGCNGESDEDDYTLIFNYLIDKKNKINSLYCYKDEDNDNYELLSDFINDLVDCYYISGLNIEKKNFFNNPAYFLLQNKEKFIYDRGEDIYWRSIWSFFFLFLSIIDNDFHEDDIKEKLSFISQNDKKIFLIGEFGGNDELNNFDKNDKEWISEKNINLKKVINSDEYNYLLPFAYLTFSFYSFLKKK